MFDYTWLHWLTFLSAALLLNISPGPDMVFIFGHTLRRGRDAGFAAMLGIWTGASLHVLTAAIGLSAVLYASAAAFMVVKWVGALYLLYLGVRLLMSRDRASAAGEDGTPPAPMRSIYAQGALVAALNPKVAVFFLAFLPQFVVAGAGPAGAQLFLHGCLIIAVAACVEPPLVLFGARLAHRLGPNPRLQSWMNRGLGLLFVTLGVRLAAAGR